MTLRVIFTIVSIILVAQECLADLDRNNLSEPERVALDYVIASQTGDILARARLAHPMHLKKWRDNALLELHSWESKRKGAATAWLEGHGIALSLQKLDQLKPEELYLLLFAIGLRNDIPTAFRPSPFEPGAIQSSEVFDGKQRVWFENALGPDQSPNRTMGASLIKLDGHWWLDIGVR